jgi:hypothetical protein
VQPNLPRSGIASDNCSNALKLSLCGSCHLAESLSLLALRLPPCSPIHLISLPSTGQALLKEFEDSLARCTSLYTDDQLSRLAPQLVRATCLLACQGRGWGGSSRGKGQVQAALLWTAGLGDARWVILGDRTQVAELRQPAVPRHRLATPRRISRAAKVCPAAHMILLIALQLSSPTAATPVLPSPPASQVSFVKRGEAAASSVPGGQPVPGFSPAEAAPVAADFSQKWQSVVEAINRCGSAACICVGRA